MTWPKKILLVGEGTEIRDTIAELLRGDTRFQLAAPCHNWADLRAVLVQDRPDLVLVDVDPRPEQAFDELDAIIGLHPAIRFVALAEETPNKLVLRAMQAGVRHVQEKRALRAELIDVCHRLLRNSAHQGGGQGNLVAVLSAGGGCGATLLAINLSNELHALTQSPVLLADFDASYGAVATYLGLSGHYGVADVLARTDQLEGDLIQSTAIHYTQGLDVLLSPFSSGATLGEALDLKSLAPFLSACRRSYAYSVLDMPRAPSSALRAVARSEATVLLVMQLAVRDVRVAHLTIATLQACGMPRERLILVVNRYARRGSPIKLEDIEPIAKENTTVCMENDTNAAVNAATYGKLLAESAPRSALRRSIASLASRIVQTQAARPAASAGGAS